MMLLVRTLGAAIAALVALAALPAVCGAASVAYIDGNEVWISSLDGAQKGRLSAGEGDWRAVTSADNGRVLGVRIEAGKISQTARFQLWENNGSVLNQAPLPYRNIGWSSYAAPLGMGLSSDGKFLAYGYGGYTGVIPNASFYNETAVITPENSMTLNLGAGQYFSGQEDPSMWGTRVIARSGSTVTLQDAASPLSATFNGILEVSGLTDNGAPLTLVRGDVAATGTIGAFEVRNGAYTANKIGVVSMTTTPDLGLAPDPRAVDCWLPIDPALKPSDVSFSPDGTKLAWQDAEGVKVAGVPTTAADPCIFSSPPVLITATGKYPSIGGGAPATLIPSLAPGTGGGAGGGTGTGGGTSGGTGGGVGGATGAAPVATVPRTTTRAKLAAGLVVRIAVSSGGRVTVTGTVPAAKLGLRGRPIVVATGSANPTAAGSLRVRLRLNARGRKALKRLRRVTLTVTVRQGTLVTKKTLRLR